MLRDGQEATDEPGQHAAPIAALKAVIGDHERLAPDGGDQRRDAGRRRLQLVGMDEPRGGEGTGQGGSQRVRGVAAHAREGAQRAYSQPARLEHNPGPRPECHELAWQLAGDRAGKLEGVAFAAPEDPLCAERGGGDVGYAHAGDLPADARRSRDRDGWLSLPPTHGRGRPHAPSAGVVSVHPRAISRGRGFSGPAPAGISGRLRRGGARQHRRRASRSVANAPGRVRAAVGGDGPPATGRHRPRSPEPSTPRRSRPTRIPESSHDRGCQRDAARDVRVRGILAPAPQADPPGPRSARGHRVLGPDGSGRTGREVAVRGQLGRSQGHRRVARRA